MPSMPGGLDDLSADWLTGALADAFPGVVVTSAALSGVLHGSAAKAQLDVTTEGAQGVPSSLVVKGSFTEGLGDDDLAREWQKLMIMVNETEVHFYRHESAVMGDRVPRCFYADTSATNSVLVLEVQPQPARQFD